LKVGGKSLSKISLVLPASNEEENIGHVLAEAGHVLERVAEDYEIIVVNDGSTDGTQTVLERLSQGDRRIVILRHERRKGYGASLKRGLAVATGEAVFFTDADQQFDLEELPLLLEWIPRYDIVVGYRRKRLDGIGRRFLGWAWSKIVRLFFRLKVRDVDCAFKLFTKEALDSIPIASVGAFVNTEILVRATKRGFRIKEVPVSHYPRKFGRQSGAHPRVVVKAIVELLRLRKELR